MADQNNENSFRERRSEQRRKAEKFHSVEFNLGGAVPIYQFGLRDISENGACILVKKDSPILQHLKVGQVMSMKFYEQGIYNPATLLKSEIRHISPGKPGDNEDLVMIGIRILERFESK
jgi:hypothetical protein